MKRFFRNCILCLLVLSFCAGMLTGVAADVADVAGGQEVSVSDGGDGDSSAELPGRTGEQADDKKDRIRIGIWCFNGASATSEEAIKSVADFGADYMMYIKDAAELYEFCTKYGIELYAQNKAFPYSAMQKGMYQILQGIRDDVYQNTRDAYPDIPSIIGDYLYDEVAPKKNNFLIIRRICQWYRERMPDKEPLINLNACYWNDGDLSVDYTFREYVETYCRMVPVDYIMYDIYPFYSIIGNIDYDFHPNYFRTLDTVAEACRKYGRDHRIILQAGTWDKNIKMTETQLRFQDYTSLAYGATDLIYACYNRCWWAAGTALWTGSSKKPGSKTALWDYGQKINTEIHALSDTFMEYTATGVYPFGSSSQTDIENQLKAQKVRSEERGFTAASLTGFDGISTEGAILAGGFAAKNGGPDRAVMFVNMTDPFNESAETTVSFRVTDPTATVTVILRGEARELTADNGVYTLTLASGDGAFVTLTH